MGRIASNGVVGPAAWLREACAPVQAHSPRLQLRASDGRLAALVERGLGAGVASHLRVGERGAWMEIAVFDGRVEAMLWQGADLLLGFPLGQAMRVFSVFPGMRLREGVGPGGLRWVRLSTRRARR